MHPEATHDEAPSLAGYPEHLGAILANATRLAALNATGLPDSPAEPSFDRLARLASQFLGVPVALVSLVDAERQFFKACVGLPEPLATERQTPLSRSFCQHVVASGEPLVIEDARLDPRVRDNSAIPDIGVVAYLGIPIIIGGQVIGSFCAIDGEPRAWTPGDVAIMGDLAQSVISEIRLRAESDDRERLRLDAEAARKNIEVTLASIADAVIAADAAGNVTFINPVASQLSGWPQNDAIGRPVSDVFRIVEEATGQVIEHFVDRVLATGEPAPWRDHTILLARDGSRSEIEESATPIMVDGQVVGAVLIFRNVGPRNKEAKSLKDAKARLQYVLNAGAVATWTWDIPSDMLIPDANMARLFSIPPELTGGCSINKFLPAIHPDDVQPTMDIVNHSLATGEYYEAEYRVIQSDGSIRWVNAKSTPTLFPDGSARSLSGVVIDVTERRQAEQEIREKETFQRLIFESVKDVSIFTTDPAGIITTWNLGAERVFGFTDVEAIGQPAAIIFTPEDQANGVPQRELANAAEVGIAGDNRWHQRKDGSRFYVNGSVHPMRDDAGRLIGFTKIARDTTETRQAQLQLQESEERFRTLFESMDEGFCIIQLRHDAEGRAEDYRFLLTNPAFETITRISNPTGHWASEVLPDLDRTWHETYARIARTGTPERFEMGEASLEARSFSVYAFRTGRPDEHKVAVLFSDITHRIRNQAEREKLVGQLTDADRRKDEFLAMLAHELRNPLGAIHSAVHLARRGEDASQLPELHETIQHQVRHLTHLIDDLLDVSRITQGKIDLRKQTVELTAITRKAAELAQPQIDEKRHELSVSTPSKAVAFVADPTRVEQMLSNLLTNAAKYSEPGRAIDLSAKVEGGEVVFRIRDQGFGITPEMLPKIFGLFTQVDATLDRARGGLGIGLTLVRNLAELHGGSVSAASEGKNKGSEFTLRLPIGQPEALQAQSAAAPLPPPARLERVRHRILIIDDNRDTARMTSRLLAHQGYEMMTAHDGFEGIEAAKAFEPDAILLDIGLPGMNGYEVAAAIRHHECCKDTIFIAVSGYGEAAARERSQEVGIDHHLTKPLDFDQLDEILKKLIDSEVNG